MVWGRTSDGEDEQAGIKGLLRLSRDTAEQNAKRQRAPERAGSRGGAPIWNCREVWMGTKLSSEISERFWRQVRKGGPSECWPFSESSRNEKGYGLFFLDGSSRKAHRVAWELTQGPILTDANILHQCDNPPCCNPAHLYPGTHADNMADMYAKRRRDHAKIRGERNGSAKLTAAQVEEIRAKLGAGGTLRGVAREYGMSHRAIGRIAHDIQWRG